MALVSLRDAIAQHVRDGQTLALEGFTHLIPFAAGHEIIRQGRRDLHLVRMTPDIVYDQMIGAGCARALTFSWGGNPGVGSLHRLRDAVEHGWPRPLAITEHSHAGMAAAYTAGASRLPFGVLRGYAGTDLPRVNDGIRSVTCPYTGEVLATVPALRPDVTILHAQKADTKGNVLLRGIVGAQKEAALAADVLLVTVEEVADDLEAPMNAVVLPHWVVTATRLRPRRRLALVRAGLLRARQRLLPGVGRRGARPRLVRALDREARDRHRGPRGVPALSRAAGGRRRRRSGPMSDARPWTADEMMTVAASRLLWDGCVCFVGIGLPSAAANLARHTHAPGLVLIYESGTIGARPAVLPLSIGDGELADTATAVVPLPEIFAYWLQAGRIDVGFLGAAQIDRFGNLNSTVIGDYARPKTRLPGAGGAPEIATHAKRTFVVLKQSPRSFVPKLDFRTSMGFLDGASSRARTGAAGAGPQVVITDYGVLKPEPGSDELRLVSRFEGVTVDAARAATGWPLNVAAAVDVVAPPTADELRVLRDLHERTRLAHGRPVPLPV